MTSSKAIEVMARAHVSYLNVNWDDMSDYTKTIELEAAAFVLIAYESHLQASGMAVVPVEPTDEMCDAAHEEIIGPAYVNAEMCEARHVWAFMLAASPYGKAVVKERDDG